MEYYDLTWREFELMRRGWNLERSYNLEGHRLVAYFIAGAFRGEGKSMPTVDKWMPLFHEDTEQETQEDLNTIRARIMERYKTGFPNKTFDA